MPRKRRLRKLIRRRRQHFSAASGADQRFIDKKVLQYLIHFLEKTRKFPQESILETCSAFLTEREMALNLRHIRSHARTRGINLKDDIELYSRTGCNFGELTGDIFRHNMSLRPFIFRIVLRSLHHYLDRMENRGRGSRLEQRLQELSELFRLDALEIEILFMFFLNEMDERFDQIADACRKWAGIKNGSYYQSVPARCIAVLTGVPSGRLSAALSLQGRIKKLALADENGSPADELIHYLSGMSRIPISASYFSQVRDEGLPLEKFTVPKDDILMVRDLLKKNRKSGSLNLLFYGRPGTGKTELAQSLGQNLGMRVYQVKSSMSDDDTAFRFRALTACRNMAETGSSLIIMDEADDLIETRGSFLFGMSKGDKARINTTLEDKGSAVIWISNSTKHADESTLRRFDFAIPFKKMSFTQRRSVWLSQLEKIRPPFRLTEENVDALAKKYEVNAGAVAFALKNAKQIFTRKTPRIRVLRGLDRLLASHVRLITGGAALKRADKTDVDQYSLEGLNISGSVPNLLRSLEAFNTGWDGLADEPGSVPVRNMNLLMYGPPGTGKTEFARYVARRLGRRLIIKKGSDLFDMWVGATEQNIREAFAEAEEDKAVLFFDEADGLISSRAGAGRNWEVTQVNEVLSGMENFTGIFICATNFKANLDEASLRRFTHKIGFDFLKPAGAETFFLRLAERLKLPGPGQKEVADIRQIKGLSPGDFHVVFKKVFHRERKGLGCGELLEMLKQETGVKELKYLERMGF